MTSLLRKQLQLYLCLIMAAALCSQLFAADSGSQNGLHAALKGRWEGTLSGEFRSQEVSWHFEVDEAGVLKGFMGPSVSGMPSLEMQNLVIDTGRVSFSIPDQHGTFDGTITPDGISGTWRQGSALPLRMTKKNFVFALSESIRGALIGRWEMDGGNPAIHLEFTEGETGTLAGMLGIPSQGLNDIPLVDIFVTPEGFAQFATDNGRRFSGRLVNGVLLGEYYNRETRYRRKFLRAGQLERGFDLDVEEDVWERLRGQWSSRVFRDSVAMRFYETAEGKRRGDFMLTEPRPRADPILEVLVKANEVSITTLDGRTFNGTLDGAEIAGEYRNNNRPFPATFTRDTASLPTATSDPAE